MTRVRIYSTSTCPICDNTKKLLTKWNIPFEEAVVDEDPDALKELYEMSSHAPMVPQITIDGTWIGGFSELTEMHMDGLLDHLVKT